MELLDFVAAKFHEEGGVFKLLVSKRKEISDVEFRASNLLFFFSASPCDQIIDSIMALFRVDFSGRGELAERQQKLAQMLSRLQKISEGDRQSKTQTSFFICEECQHEITLLVLVFSPLKSICPNIRLK